MGAGCARSVSMLHLAVCSCAGRDAASGENDRAARLVRRSVEAKLRALDKTANWGVLPCWQAVEMTTSWHGLQNVFVSQSSRTNKRGKR
eukprot:1205920-Rhodomonas_salina.2